MSLRRLLRVHFCVTGFSWSDGSPRDYVNWGNGEPNDYYDNEDCVTHQNMWLSKWNDDNCYTLYPYICKIRKGNHQAVRYYTAFFFIHARDKLQSMII